MIQATPSKVISATVSPANHLIYNSEQKML